MRVIIVSGLSGAGKSVALHMLEDLGTYCVDNLPAPLLMEFVNHAASSGVDVYERTAIGIDARNEPHDIAEVPAKVRSIRERGIECDLIFLNASEDALIKRYSETRRRHPLSGRSLSLRAALERERDLMLPVSEVADLTIDTSLTNVHQLRELVRNRIDRRDTQRLSLLFESFAFRHSVPSDADSCSTCVRCPTPTGIRICARSPDSTSQCAVFCPDSSRSLICATTSPRFSSAGSRNSNVPTAVT
jgi:UPF0042 nucleotide-binding protein